MKNKNIVIIIIAVLVVISLFCILLEQIMFSMNHMMYMTFQFTSFAGILSLLGFLSFEGAGDERLENHKKNAGRAGYILGLIVSSIGLIIQSQKGIIDPWLISVVIFMILGQLITRVYLNFFN